MITRDTDVEIEFHCQPITAGYATGDHVCTWRFSGSAEVLTGTTVSHSWPTGGIHRATVTATNAAAGTSASASFPLLIVKQPNIADPAYFLIDKPAAATVRTAIYYLDGDEIHLWNPDEDTDVVFSDLPNASEIGTCETPPTFQGFEVSDTYLHAHYLTTITQTGGEFAPHWCTSSRLISLRRPLDLSAIWTIYSDVWYIVWVYSGGIMPWPHLETMTYKTFADGRTWVLGDVVAGETIRNTRDIITGEAETTGSQYSAAAPVYYVSADRWWLGTDYASAFESSGAISEGRSTPLLVTQPDFKINNLGAIPWVFFQVSTTLHTNLASLYKNDPSYILGSDVTKANAVMSTVIHPVPFGTRSLVVLAEDLGNEANAVWWTGTEFLDEFLGDAARSSLVPKLHSSGLAFARTGKMYRLADGSLLHCLA